MEVANCRVRLNKVGSDTPVNNITPAEAMLLHILHGNQNGGMTFGEEFEKIKVVGTAMVDTGDKKKVVDVPACAAKYETQIVEAAVAQQGVPGQPGFVPAKPAVTNQVLVATAVDEVSHLEPVLRPRTDAEELRRLGSKYNGARDKANKPIIDTVWPDKLNPRLPQTFKEIKWTDVSGVAAGVETASVNYATGGLATTALPTR